MRNVGLFDRIAALIEDDPGTYDQDEWATDCGSAFCIAGHAVIESRLLVWSRGRRGFFLPSGVEVSLPADVPVLARVALGLNLEESSALFSAYWKPKIGESVPAALRRIGRGGEIE